MLFAFIFKGGDETRSDLDNFDLIKRDSCKISVGIKYSNVHRMEKSGKSIINLDCSHFFTGGLFKHGNRSIDLQ